MERPKLLYTYQPATPDTLASLAAGKIWFSDSTKFNDPFDCALEVRLAQLSDAQIAEMIEYFAPPPDLEKAVRNLSPDEKRQHITNGLRAAAAERMARLGGVCCLTSRVDNMLMWGHYASCHRGFCLEFDTSVDPFTKALEVNYASSFPELGLDAKGQLDYQQFKRLILTKAEFWSYEKEWRLFHSNRSQLFGYERRALTGIYFGAKMPDDVKIMIGTLLDATDTKLHQVKLSRSSFALEIEPVTFTRVDYRSKAGMTTDRPGG